MKSSKRFAALFAAVLMFVTMFTGGAVQTFAKNANATISCGSYKASCSLVSANKYSGIAITNSASKDSSGNSIKFNTLYAGMFGTRVDKNGDNPKYISGPGKEASNATSASDGIPVLSSTGGYYYAKMATAHIAIKNGVESSKALTVAY